MKMRINRHPDLDSVFREIHLPYWGIGIADERTVRGQARASVHNVPLFVVSICSPYRRSQKFAYDPSANRHLSYVEPFSWDVDYHVEVREQLALVQRRVEPYLVARGVLRNAAGLCLENAVFEGEIAGLQPEFGVDNTDNDDRAIAVEMGLGKLGRNQLVIHPSLGTHFFIGYLIYGAFDEERAEALLREGSTSSFELICERCQKCVLACPTEALTNGFEHCLSYLTQFTGEVAEEKRNAFGNRLYGCSECQRVCPYNRMEHGISGSYVNPFEILMYTNKTFKRDYGHMGFAWRTLRVYKRNALINIGNTGGEPELRRLMDIRALNDPSIQIPDNLMQYLDWAIKEIKKRIN